MSVAWTFLWVACGVGLSLVVYGLLGRRARRIAARAPVGLTYNVELPPPQPGAFTLCCPRCGFQGPFDDLSLVGQSVDCPLCERNFVVLEPEVAASAAGA